jgi:hypothetical protein
MLMMKQKQKKKLTQQNSILVGMIQKVKTRKKVLIPKEKTQKVMITLISILVETKVETLEMMLVETKVISTLVVGILKVKIQKILKTNLVLLMSLVLLMI